MNWIGERIKAEYRKHEKNNLNWIELASLKIQGTLEDKMDKLKEEANKIKSNTPQANCKCELCQIMKRADKIFRNDVKVAEKEQK